MEMHELQNDLQELKNMVLEQRRNTQSVRKMIENYVFQTKQELKNNIIKNPEIALKEVFSIPIQSIRYNQTEIIITNYETWESRETFFATTREYETISVIKSEKRCFDGIATRQEIDSIVKELRKIGFNVRWESRYKLLYPAFIVL